MAIPTSLRQDLCDIPVLEDPGSLRMRSRDFFWFSPILKETLDGKRADIVVVPRDKADVMRVAAACARNSGAAHRARRRNRKLRAGSAARGRGRARYDQARPGDVASAGRRPFWRRRAHARHRSRPRACRSRAALLPVHAPARDHRRIHRRRRGRRWLLYLGTDSRIRARSSPSKLSPSKSIRAWSSCVGATCSR